MTKISSGERQGQGISCSSRTFGVSNGGPTLEYMAPPNEWLQQYAVCCLVWYSPSQRNQASNRQHDEPKVMFLRSNRICTICSMHIPPMQLQQARVDAEDQVRMQRGSNVGHSYRLFGDCGSGIKKAQTANSGDMACARFGRLDCQIRHVLGWLEFMALCQRIATPFRVQLSREYPVSSRNLPGLLGCQIKGGLCLLLILVGCDDLSSACQS